MAIVAIALSCVGWCWNDEYDDFIMYTYIHVMLIWFDFADEIASPKFHWGMFDFVYIWFIWHSMFARSKWSKMTRKMVDYSSWDSPYRLVEQPHIVDTMRSLIQTQ